MTALAVILIVSAVIIILLLLPIVVRVKYDGKLYLYAGYITAFRIYPAKKGKQKNKNVETDARKRKSRVRKRSLSFSEITELAQEALKAVKKLLKSIRIPIFILHLIISGSDAAKAAVNYGNVCMALSSLYPIIEDNAKVRKTDISVDLDYGGKSTVFLDVTLRAMFAKILIITVTALIAAFKVIKKDKRKAEKNNEQHPGKHGNGDV